MKANDLKTMHALYPNSPSNSKPSYLHQLLMLSSQRRLYSLMSNILRANVAEAWRFNSDSKHVYLFSFMIFFFCHEWNQVLKPEWQFLLLFLDAKITAILTVLDQNDLQWLKDSHYSENEKTLDTPIWVERPTLTKSQRHNTKMQTTHVSNFFLNDSKSPKLTEGE